MAKQATHAAHASSNGLVPEQVMLVRYWFAPQFPTVQSVQVQTMRLDVAFQ